jgi:hypothetical protein
MLRITPTQLRKDVYNILNSVLKTGVSVEITYHKKTLKISTKEAPSKLAKLKPIPHLIKGDPKDLEKIDWSKEWKP